MGKLEENAKPTKKTLLILGIAMLRAGTEKAFLSFARRLDFERYDVTLLLARAEGPLLSEIPPQIRVRELGKERFGDFFLLSGANAAKNMFDCFIRNNPLTAFEILPYFVRILFSRGKKRQDTATRMWVEMAKKHLPQVTLGEDGEPRFDNTGKEYDVCAAYWGDRTMFWMCDRAAAKKKLAWLHFDYFNPPREDELYLDYFRRCDAVVTVSGAIDASLKKALPAVADRCVLMENLRDVDLLRKKMIEGDGFEDRCYTGKRILSVGRICEQKGFDMIIPVLRRFAREGRELRWYIIGGGSEEDVNALKGAAVENGVADRLMLLGEKENPYGYFRECDLYVQPSRHEGKPITVEEAKMLRCPILVTNYLSASDQLDGGRLGCICDISPDGIYDGVRKMLDDEEMTGEFVRRLSEIDFSNEKEMEVFYRLAEAE